MPDTVKLTYASSAPWYRRKRTRRVIWAGSLILLALGAYLARHRIAYAYGRLQMLNAQRACMAYQGPADQIAYTDEPEKVKEFSGGVGGYQLRTVRSPALDYRYVSLPVEPLNRFIAPPSFGPQETVHGIHCVVHGLTAGGQQRLLILQLLFGRQSPDQLTFVAYIVPPRGFREPDESWTEQVMQLPVASGAALKPLRLYAAQFDPADASRFSIRYESSGKPGHLDGQMVIEHGHPKLELKVRDGPLSMWHSN